MNLYYLKACRSSSHGRNLSDIAVAKFTEAILLPLNSVSDTTGVMIIEDSLADCSSSNMDHLIDLAADSLRTLDSIVPLKKVTSI